MPMTTPIIRASQYSLARTPKDVMTASPGALGDVETSYFGSLRRAHRAAHRSEETPPQQRIGDQGRPARRRAEGELSPAVERPPSFLGHEQRGYGQRREGDEHVVAHHRGKSREQTSQQRAPSASFEKQSDGHQAEREPGACSQKSAP